MELTNIMHVFLRRQLYTHSTSEWILSTSMALNQCYYYYYYYYY